MGEVGSKLYRVSNYIMVLGPFFFFKIILF